MESVSGCVPDGVVEHLVLFDGFIIMPVNSGGCCLIVGLEVDG